MRSFTRFTQLALIVSLLAAHAPAQNLFCIAGDLTNMSAVQKTMCLAKLDQVRNATEKFGAPSDWHYVVVCGESAWRTYEVFSERSEAELERSSADTNLKGRTTFFRGDRLLTSEFPDNLEKVVAYEVASILLQTTDEKTIQRQVALWIPHRTANDLNLQASLREPVASN